MCSGIACEMRQAPLAASSFSILFPRFCSAYDGLYAPLMCDAIAMPALPPTPVLQQLPTCRQVPQQILGGELLHVDMFAHNKSGIAYRDGNRRSKTVVNHKREPHQQLRLLPSCTN
jgi:hypothetical protein